MKACCCEQQKNGKLLCKLAKTGAKKDERRLTGRNRYA
jgi:hypothetical protein